MNGITIKQAVEISGLCENYIRKAIRSGDLQAVKELVPGTQNNWRNVIVNFDEWRASTKQRTTREDGRNKFVVYLNADEEAQLQKLIADMPFAELLKRANVKVEEEAEAE